MESLEIKICGLTNLDDASFALEQGADYLGFVLYEHSPRAIDAARLGLIRGKLPGSARVVGVFVNMPREDVARIVEDCGLFAAQIHGDEAWEEYAGMTLRIWRALRVGAGACRPDPARWPAERYVADADTPGQYGGTGTLADWRAAGALAKDHPIMLAGGLTPETVDRAVRLVRPAGVDVSSGVESRAGRKDRGKLARFIAAARAAVVG